jgi:arylsulfatase A-like enzyme
VRLGVVKMQVHLLPYLFALGTASNIPELQAYERTADPRWLTKRFLTWLDSRESDKPFLAVIFFSTTHFPYAAPYPWYRTVLSEEYGGPHKYCKVGLGLSSYTPEDEVRVRSIFAGTVRAVDDEVARLKALLQRNGFWDSTIVVVTADHGESLYEHGRGNGHGDTLDGSESLKVPLLFRVPGVESARVSGHASNMDLAPTLLGFLGVEVPEWMEGVNLAAEEGHKPPADRAIFSETGLLFVNPDVSLEGRSIRYGNLAAMFDYTQETSDIFLQGRVESDALVAKHHMILKGDKKLIYVPSRSKATLQCFDLSKDPDETNPLNPRADPACEALIEPLYDHMLGSGGRRIGDFVVP